MSLRVQRFLIGTGAGFPFVNLARFCRLAMVYPADRYSELHLIVTRLLLVISGPS